MKNIGNAKERESIRQFAIALDNFINTGYER